MGLIQQLDIHLSNMIAAGEVVERPYSVVKELIENSIDANATIITINLIESGMQLIEIIDNGCGMSKEDAHMAFKRHATSKIKNQHDLYRISSLGFRGEAIPSIASVSQFDLLTNDGEKNGYKITYKAGKLINECSIAMNKGTTIKVSQLFFNTPARLKYVKSLNVELAYITDLVDKLALSNKSIRFKLTNNGKEIFQSIGNGDMQALIGNIYGIEAAKNLVYQTATCPGVNMELYLVKSTVSRSRKNDVTILANKRYVKNNDVINAVIDGYATYLPSFRFPIAIIDITIDPLLIDVNVHPSKVEIKFSEIDILKYTITKAIKDAFKVETVIQEPILKEPVETFQKQSFDFFNQRTITLGQNIEAYEKAKVIEESNMKEDIIIKEKIMEEKLEPYQNKVETAIKQPRIPYLEFIGIAQGTYLLFQNDEGLYLVDQHAAEERINYEYYYRFFAEEHVASIDLLIPQDIECTRQEALYLLDNLDKLETLGFKLEQSGIHSFFVRSIPTYIKNTNVEEVVSKIIYFIIERNSLNLSVLRDPLAKMIACKKSIKANHRINLDEVEVLMQKLNECENPFTCPHGRPTLVKITNLELEKMFKRVM